MTSNTKILFIGIDSADKDLLSQWANAGKLPNFKALFQQAAWGTTTNPVGFYVGALWPSFATGLSAASHGRYCYEQTKVGDYKQHRFNIHDLNGEMFWDVLSRAGRRVAVIDVPLTPQSEQVNGIQVTDWGVHKANQRDVFSTCPASLAQAIEAEFGKNPIPVCNDIERTTEGFKDFREKMLERVGKKADLSTKFLAQGEWDLFLTVFTEPHCIGHQCWHFHDSNHPSFNSDLVKALGDPVLDVYQELDTAIGRVMDKVGPETLVFVYSSHGMGPHYEPNHFLDDILKRLDEANNSRFYLVDHLTQFSKRALRYMLRNIGLPIPKVLMPKKTVNQKIDRTFFAVTNNNSSGAIRINLAGREPAGKIHPGRDYEKCCEKLSKDLKAIINVDTGKPLVRAVLRTSEHYSGKYIREFPDLIVEWNRKNPISVVSSPKIGRISHKFNHVRTGDHLDKGIFFIKGPGIKPGKIEQPISVLDFAPTITHLLGVALPNAEGTVIPPTANLHLVPS